VFVTARLLLHEWLAAHPDAALRLLGVGVGELQIVRQGDLFGQPQRASRLDATVDGIRDRFGAQLLTRASLLPRTRDGAGPRRG
jgi:hypothetical protein